MHSYTGPHSMEAILSVEALIKLIQGGGVMPLPTI
jgi:hypothetical protein